MNFSHDTPALIDGTEVIWTAPNANNKQIKGTIRGIALTRQPVVGTLYILELSPGSELDLGDYPYSHVAAFEVHLELDLSAPGGMSWAAAQNYR